ncbi:MAG: ArnT family glycosyltransferase [Anaerolineae bacterium]
MRNYRTERTRVDKRLALALFLLLTGLYGLTTGGYIDSADGELMYRVTEGLIERGTFAQASPPEGMPLTLMEGRNGVYYAVTGPVQSLVAIPLYLVGRWVSLTVPPVFKGYLLRFFVSLLNGPVTAATAACLFLFGRDLGYRRRTALFVALAFGMASVAWPYARTFFAESFLAFWLLMTTWTLHRYKQSQRTVWMVLAGTALAVGFGTKYVMAVAGPAFLLYVLALGSNQPPSNRRKWLRRTLISFGVPFATLIGLLMLFNYARFGNVFETGYTHADSRGPIDTWAATATPLISLYGFLFSSGKGFFFFSPPTLLCLWGWGLLARRRKWEAILILSIAVLFPLFYSLTTSRWFGGANWGPRYIVCITPFVILPLGAFIEHRSTPRWVRLGAPTVLFVIGFWVQASNVIVNNNRHLFSDTPFDSQLFHPRYSTLGAQWTNWPRSMQKWLSYDHTLRSEGSNFYLIDTGFYPTEVVEMAPFGRWMGPSGRLYVYTWPTEQLRLQIHYSRPRTADQTAESWEGIRYLYDGREYESERWVTQETTSEIQWSEVVTIPAQAIEMWPGTLHMDARGDVPNDQRELSIFVADVQIQSDAAQVSYVDTNLPPPLPVSDSVGWDRQDLFWLYDPEIARPLDIWIWYIWTSGLRPTEARALIASLTLLYAVVALGGCVHLVRQLSQSRSATSCDGPLV